MIVCFFLKDCKLARNFPSQSLQQLRWQLLASQTEPVKIGVLKEQLLEKEKANKGKEEKHGVIFFEDKGP